MRRTLVKHGLFGAVRSAHGVTMSRGMCTVLGMAIALLMTTFAVKVLRLLPAQLDDATVAKLEH